MKTNRVPKADKTPVKRILTFPVPVGPIPPEVAEMDAAKLKHYRWATIEYLLGEEGYELVRDLFEHSIRIKKGRNAS